MALGTRYPLKVTIIAAVGTMVGTVAAIMGFSAERKRVSVRSYQSCCCHRFWSKTRKNLDPLKETCKDFWKHASSMISTLVQQNCADCDVMILWRYWSMQADQLVWIDDENKCKVPNNPALSLSIMAAFLLLAAQISLTVAGGCVCCNPGINKYISPAPLAIKSLILSW